MPQSGLPPGVTEVPLQPQQAQSALPPGVRETPVAQPTQPAPSQRHGNPSALWDQIQGTIYPQVLQNYNRALNYPLGHLLGIKTMTEQYGPQLTQAAQQGGAKGMAADAAKLALGLGDFMTTPVGVATQVAGGPGSSTAVKGLVAGSFAASEVSASAESIPRAIRNPTPENVQEALLHPGLAALMGAGALHEARATSGIKAIPKLPDVPEGVTEVPLQKVSGAPRDALHDALSNFVEKLPQQDKPEPIAPVVGQPNVAAKVDASAKPELTKAAKIEQATVSPTNTSWTAAEFDNLIMRARAVQLNPKATIEERSVAASMEATLREQQSQRFPQPEQSEQAQPKPQPITGAQPTQLKPGDELPRPLGQSIKSELPPRTVANAPAEPGGERAEPEPGVIYGEPEEPLKTVYNAKVEALNASYYKERLVNPELYDSRVTGPHGQVMVPVGGARRSGYMEAMSREGAEEVLSTIQDKPGFPNARLVPYQNAFEVHWGEPIDPDNALQTGLSLGYKPDLVRKFAGVKEAPAERPRVPKETASPNELPPGLQQILDKLENNRSRQAIPGRPEQALIGDRNERQYLESKRTELTDNYARLLKERSYDASAVVKAKSQGLTEKISYLESHLAKRDQIENFKAAAKEALSTGYETTPTGEESGLKRHIESQPLAVREAIGEAFGNRRVDVPNRLYAKRVQTALSKGEEVPSDEASPELLQLKRQYEDLKERVKDAVKLTGAMPDEDDVAKLKTLESKLVLGALRSHGHPKIADVAVAKGVPVADVASTGAGKAVDIKHGGLPVMTQQIWEREYGGAKGKALPTVDQLQDKLAELKDSKSHLDAMAARLDYFADAFKKQSGVSVARVATGIATGGVTGGIAGAVVGGPVGGLVGSALGMAAGGITSAFDLKSAFPTVYDRLSEFARQGSVDEDLTPGLIGKSILRENRGDLDRRQAQLKEQTRDLTKRIDKQWSAKQGIDYMIAAAHGAPMTGDAQTLHDLTEQIFAPRRDMIENLEHGSYDNWRENYFPGMYEKAGAVKDWLQKSFLSKRPISGSGAFKRAKVFEDMGEAMAAGFKPLTTNPLAMVMLKAAEMDKYILGHKTLADFKAQGIAKFFKSGADAPQGWRKFDDRIAEVVSRNEAGERVIRGSYYGPPDAVQAFNNYVSPGLKGLSPTAHQGYQVLRAIGNAENQFQLGMSAFHISTTGFNAITSDLSNAFDQAGHGELLESGKSGLRAVSLVGSIAKTYYDGSKIMEEYLSPGSFTKYSQTADAVARAGGRATMDQQYISNQVDKVRTAWSEGKVVSAAAHVPFAAVELTGRFVMQRIVPPMKLGVFHGMAADIFARAQEHGWSETQVTRELDRAWNSVDGRMGQVVYDNIFVNKVAKELAFGAIRSAGWTGGTIAELGGGAIDAARSLARVATGDDISLSRRTKYTIALAMATGYVGALMNYAYTGHAPQSLRDMYQIPTGRTGSDGRKEYVNIPSYMKDLFAYRFQPGQTILNKAHPLLHSVAEMLQNKDYYGVEIAHQDDPMVKQLGEYAEFALKQFIPFSVTNAEHRVKSTPGSLVQSIFGVTPAPRYATMTPAERDLYNDSSQKLGGVRTQEAFERSQLKSNLEEAFRTHDVEARRRLIKEGYDKGQLAPKDLDNIIESSRQPYFDSAVKRASLEDLVKLYATDKPNKSERSKLQLGILEKMDSGLDDKPRQERDEIMRLYREGRGRQSD